MDRRDIIAKVIEVIELANKTFPQANLSIPSIEFYKKGSIAGRAWQGRNHVSFNEVLAKENPDTFHETVIHEISHLVTPKVYPRHKQAHGPEFKYVDLVLGGRGTRCHSYDVSTVKVSKTKTRYEVKCDCQTHWVTKKVWLNSMVGSGRVYCKACKGTVKSTGNKKTFV